MALFPVPQKKLSADPSIIGSADLFITETEADAVVAAAAGFSAIGFPNNSRTDENYSILIDISLKSKRIFLVNSTGDTQRLSQIGFRLASQWVPVLMVNVYDDAAAQFQTLSDYLQTHTPADFEALTKRAKAFVEILIGQLPTNFMQASPALREHVLPLLNKADDATRQYFIDMIAKHVKAKVTVITKMLKDSMAKQAAIAKQEAVKQAEEPEEVDPEIQATALALAKDPQLLKKRIDTVNRAGVVNERKNIALYNATFDSRLIKDGAIPGQNVLAVKNAGHFGAGKSYSLFLCMSIYPEEAYHLITSGSEKSLYYLENGLRHKLLVVTEGFQFTSARGDSEIAYVVRSLLSEGRIIRLVSQKGEDGKMATKEVIIDGPTPFITTTVVHSLEPQLEDRMFTTHPDESSDQTIQIIFNKAEQSAGKIGQLPARETQTWKQVHRIMDPVSVVIHFAPGIALHIAKMQPISIATRRAYNKVLNVIQATACLYQHQRVRDEQGNVVADIADYWMARQIVSEAFRENLGQESKITNDRLEYLQKVLHAPIKDLSKHFGVSKSAISTWAKHAEEDTLVQWVDDQGVPFKDDTAMKKGKRSGKAHLAIVAQSATTAADAAPALSVAGVTASPGGPPWAHLFTTQPVGFTETEPVGFIESEAARSAGDQAYWDGITALTESSRKDQSPTHDLEQDNEFDPGDSDHENPLI